MSNQNTSTSNNAELIARANRVIPGGMYGHQKLSQVAEGFPQFFKEAQGAILRDADDREYVDFLLGYGPMVLGYHNQFVDEAVAKQRALLDMSNGPTHLMVDLAEKLVSMVGTADWAFFAKNGTDGTTTALTIARATTGKKKILVERGSYHGAATWSTPVTVGIAPEDRANIIYFDYNDDVSLLNAFELAGDDLAAVIVTPFKHNDGGYDQEFIKESFATTLRAECDKKQALLILDDVRCVMRLEYGSSWSNLHIQPDLMVWGKAMSNGYAISAVLGTRELEKPATSIFSTGTFWYGAVSMAASLATLEELEKSNGIELQKKAGQTLRDGLLSQAKEYNFNVSYTGPLQMPYMRFTDGQHAKLNTKFSELAIKHGVYLHPKHNWFTSTAHTEEVMDRALEATGQAFKELAKFV